jgi:hypothetical protein
MLDLVSHLEHLVLAALLVALLLLNRSTQRPLARRSRRTVIVLDAIAYADQVGGDARAKKAHALDYARKLDLADNRKRDYSDAELGMSIEAELGKRP